jgi:hypothetical protein
MPSGASGVNRTMSPWSAKRRGGATLGLGGCSDERAFDVAYASDQDLSAFDRIAADKGDREAAVTASGSSWMPGSPVSVRVYPERIAVVAEGQIICEHRRVFARSDQRKSTMTVFDWRHYLAVIQRKPGALRNGAPFAELPPAFRALQQRMLKTPGGDRKMVEILALVLHHDEQAVLAAVELALEAGAPTKTHILNVLHRLVDGKPIDPPAVKPPNALTLTTEPQANVQRYDALRKAPEARHAS